MDNETEIKTDSRIPAIRALYVPNFRTFWCGLLVSNIGTWAQNIAQGWLVYDLTHSSLYLGIVGFASMLPLLFFLLVGGAIADRFERKKLLLFTQTILLLDALVLAILTLTHLVQVWHVIILAIITGTVMAFDSPARQAFVQDLVKDEDLMNAVALNSATFNAARIIGPAIAGALVASVGIASCFFVNAASFLAVLIALSFVKPSPYKEVTTRTGLFEDIVEGFGYLKNNPTIFAVVLLAAVPAIFTMPYTTLMPAFAREVLHSGAKEYGILMSTTGVGALVGAMGLAALSDYPHRGRLLLSGLFLMSGSLIGLSLCHTFWLSVLFLPFIGMSVSTYAATSNTTLQIMAQPELRGRVLSAYMVCWMGMAPFGNLQVGLISNYLGVAMAFRIGALICGVVSLMVLFFRQDVRCLKV